MVNIKKISTFSKGEIRMKIQVNKNHILWGEQGSAECCPIALAICEKKFRKK